MRFAGIPTDQQGMGQKGHVTPCIFCIIARLFFLAQTRPCFCVSYVTYLGAFGYR